VFFFRSTIFIFAVLISIQVQAATNSKENVTAETVQQKTIEELAPAALSGKTEIIKSALENGFDPNQKDGDGRSLLMYSSFNGHTEIVKMLITSGAYVNAIDLTGSTALMYAASGPFSETVKLLLENGAHVDAVDSNEHFSALMHAAAEGQIEVVRLLIENNATLSLTDKDGDTAQSFAAQKGHTDVVQVLREAAASK